MRTSRTLILMRHAKSDWADSSLSDFDRPLNRRGRSDAPVAASVLIQQGFHPDRILCSTAVRTQATFNEMRQAGLNCDDLILLPELYLANVPTLISAIQQHGQQAEKLMVIAHNPGLETLVSVWAGHLQPFPTSAIAVFEFEISDWSLVDHAIARQFCPIWRPKD